MTCRPSGGCKPNGAGSPPDEIGLEAQPIVSMLHSICDLERNLKLVLLPLDADDHGTVKDFHDGAPCGSLLAAPRSQQAVSTP